MAKTYEVTGFRRLGNKVTSALARRGKGPAWELTVRGRRSGTPRTVPVTPIDVDGSRYLVAPYGAVGWVHNIRAAGGGALNRGGVTRRITAVETEGEEAGKVLMAYHGELVRIVGKYFELPENSGLADFVAIVPDHPVFRIE
jgi:deazaflavin-dependent oxidoreductase (nitroreductase family)